MLNAQWVKEIPFSCGSAQNPFDLRLHTKSEEDPQISSYAPIEILLSL